MGIHRTVSGFIGIVYTLDFFVWQEQLDEVVSIFEIDFYDPCFGTEGVKEYHSSLFYVDALAEGFCQINKPVEHELKSNRKFCLKWVNLETSGTTSNPQKSRNL